MNIRSALLKCTCFYYDSLETLGHVYSMFILPFLKTVVFFVLKMPHNFLRTALHADHQNRKTVRSSKNMCRCQQQQKKTLPVFPPSATAWLKVLTAGGFRYQSVGATRRLKDVMQCSGRRWNPLSDHAEQWQQPQHTRKNISRCSPRRITNPPPTQTHILWATHGLHIMEAWSQSSHFSSCPHLFTYCTCAVRSARTELLRPFSCLCYFRQQEDNKMSSLIRNIY